MRKERTIRLRADLHHKLKVEAAERGELLKELIDKIVQEWLRREAKKR